MTFTLFFGKINSEFQENCNTFIKIADNQTWLSTFFLFLPVCSKNSVFIYFNGIL